MGSSLLSLIQTADQKIYEATCLDLIRELSQNLAEDRPTKESFTSMNGVDKCVQEINFTKAIHELYKEYHHPEIIANSTDEQANSWAAWKSFTKEMDISKIGNHDMSIQEAMDLAGNLKKDIGNSFYGMLLTTSGNKKSRTVFNPLHPIIVTELLKEDTTINKERKEWSIAIYSWKSKTFMSNRFPKLYNKLDYIPEIANVIAAINTPSNYIIENKNFNVDIVNDKFVLNYEEIKKERESGDVVTENGKGRNYLIPGQIINISGIAYPYYGVIYSRKGLAWNMCPMYGANINHPSGQSKGGGMEGGSRICTHSGNSKTQMGVSSLNHANTTSPLNSYLLQDGSITYAGQCVDASLEMFLGETYTGKNSKPKKALTFQEFKNENNGNGTKAQYLQYIKNRLSETMEPDSVEKKEEVKEEVKKELPKFLQFQTRRNYKIGHIAIDGNPRIKINEKDWANYTGNHLLGRRRKVITKDSEVIQVMTNYGWQDATSDTGFPDYDGSIDRVEGDIVNDQFLEPPRLRILTNTGWEDYVEPPTPLPAMRPPSEDVPVVPRGTLEHPTEFVDGIVYEKGEVVIHEGRKYIALMNAALIPKPGDDHIWQDLDNAIQAED